MPPKSAESDLAAKGSAEKLTEAAADYAPSAFAPYVKAVAPVVGKISAAASASMPHIINVYHICADTYAILPAEIMQIIGGLLLCFFGGV